MNVLEFVEGGGLLIVCALLIAFAIARSKGAGGEWPRGILPTNFLVLMIIGTGFFGIATFIHSFSS
ncbi:hypothetical protein GCM10017083_49720 [Thalassobaculum fulvum]|uniref:Uncharacterized protein n=1 Tax=Thalassobaculum fulvum TaxID=1633335 RepID=A0A918XWL8_9PROT|nr:hypothetical protein [Thalassobaculum fulvum]GHD61826.1 hypothetical protein GCM10017083_49720 [Thalassobaculum fulvum]